MKATGFKVVSVDLPGGESIRPFGWDMTAEDSAEFVRLVQAAGSADELQIATAAFPSHGPASANRWTLVVEAVFERVRRDEFPDKPCRVGSVFLFERLQDAFAFAGLRPPGHIFAGEYPTEGVAHRGDFHLNIGMRGHGRPADFGTDFEENVEAARKYWQGAKCCDNSMWELLLVPGMAFVQDGTCLAQ